MPIKKSHYILTPTAEHDFRQAKQWSISRWGNKLTQQYFVDLHQAAERIAKNYFSKSEKNSLTGASGLGIQAVREHYIVYLPFSSTSVINKIVIVALIRQNRDVPAILKTNSYIIQRELKAILSAN